MDELIAAINAASTGSEIRVPLVNAFRWVFEKGKDASTLNHQTSDYYAKQSNMAKLLPFDTWSRRPASNSEKLVAGGTIFSFTGDLNELPTLVEEIIDHG